MIENRNLLRLYNAKIRSAEKAVNEVNLSGTAHGKLSFGSPETRRNPTLAKISSASMTSRQVKVTPNLSAADMATGYLET